MENETAIEKTEKGKGVEILEELMRLGMEALALAKNEQRDAGLEAAGPAFEQAFARHLRARLAQAAQALTLELGAAMTLGEALGQATARAQIAKGIAVVQAAQPALRSRLVAELAAVGR